MGRCALATAAGRCCWQVSSFVFLFFEQTLGLMPRKQLHFQANETSKRSDTVHS